MVAPRDVQPSLSPLDSTRLKVLVIASAGRMCALPLHHVREIMRPLPVEPFREAPAFVLGLSVIRGGTIPVVDLARLLGAEGVAGSVTRYVTLKVDGRAVALAVGEVLGIRELQPGDLSALPALVDSAATDVVASLSTHDQKLLRVLRAASVLPDATWAALSRAQVKS